MVKIQNIEALNNADWVSCDLCAVRFDNSRWKKEFFGFKCCMWCWGRNGKGIAALAKLVSVLAERNCDNEIDGDTVTVPCDAGPFCGPHYYPVMWCNLDCKCVPCQARRVMGLFQFHMKPSAASLRAANQEVEDADAPAS